MPSLNKVLLIGHLGKDPETKYLPSGDAVCSFSIATTEKWKDKQGQSQEVTTWHQIVFFGRLAEVCAQYLRKGSAVYVEGSIHTRKYTDKQGVERYVTEVKGANMQMLGGRQQEAESPPAKARPTQQELPGGLDQMQDDIPF